jgi:pimeloyl-ACP methyl ester carboxylesterase
MTVGNADPALALAEPWGGVGRVSDLDGPVHWVHFGGPADGGGPRAPVVLIHGLGGSHLNWVRIAPGLVGDRRVVALDLAGFGLTPAAGRSTSVQANKLLLARFIEEVVGGPAVVVGNSMGGMIAALLAVDQPSLVVGLGLIDPSLPLLRLRHDPVVAAQFALFSTPFVGEGYLRRTNRRFSAAQRVRGTLDLCFADVERADAGVVEADVALAEHRVHVPGAEAGFVTAARSILFVLGRSKRYAADLRKIGTPVLLVHGEEDRLVPISAARAAVQMNPSWEHEFLEGVGHVPQLEAPERVIERLGSWLDGLPA